MNPLTLFFKAVRVLFHIHIIFMERLKKNIAMQNWLTNCLNH